MSQFREVAITLNVIVCENFLLREYSQMNLLFECSSIRFPARQMAINGEPPVPRKAL